MVKAIYFDVETNDITRVISKAGSAQEFPYQLLKPFAGEGLLVMEDSSVPDNIYEYKANAEGLYIDEPEIELGSLKEILIAEVKREAWNRLSGTDWYVIRSTETGDPVPANVSAYRAAVRTASDNAEQAIQLAETKEQAESVEPDWPDELEQ